MVKLFYPNSKTLYSKGEIPETYREEKRFGGPTKTDKLVTVKFDVSFHARQPTQPRARLEAGGSGLSRNGFGEAENSSHSGFFRKIFRISNISGSGKENLGRAVPAGVLAAETILPPCRAVQRVQGVRPLAKVKPCQC